DLDRFADISDSLGPANADQLLTAVSRRLREVARAGQYYLAHLGRDQFALVVEYTSTVEDVVKAAEHAMRALPNPYRLAGHDVAVAAKAGIVERPCLDATADELLRGAWQALSWAKADDQLWMIFKPERDDLDQTRYAISAAMPAALSADQFSLVYQPLVRLS